MKMRAPSIFHSARFMRRILNLYGPFFGAGVQVTQLADDYSSATVQLKLRFYNKNYVGTQFGGSMYAMTDPCFMLLVMNQLGHEYIVWDKSGSIDYISPGRSTLTADFKVTAEQIADIKRHTEGGEKYLPEFSVDIHDSDAVLVARVIKTLYIRKKQPKKPI